MQQDGCISHPFCYMKEARLESYILCDSIDRTSWKGQKSRDGEQIHGCRVGVVEGATYTGTREGLEVIELLYILILVVVT